jgi:hypothetical protein
VQNALAQPLVTLFKGHDWPFGFNASSAIRFASSKLS